MKKLTKGLLGAALLSVAASASAVTDADIDNSFKPYTKGFPTVEGVVAGLVINKSNVDTYASVLDVDMIKHVKDGWVEITVGEPMDFVLNQGYIDATKAGAKAVNLGAEVGQLEGYIAGRAFPEEPSMDDPRAGEKLAWNYQYGYNWGDGAAISPFYWKYRNMNTGKIERTLKFNFYFLNFAHRVNHEPLPEFEKNPSKLFRAIYLNVAEPFDVKNTQLLIHRSQNDLKRDNAWLYLGFQRRVRRLATGQVTDSFLGSDLMIEDFEGYNGRISDMNWTYKGTRTMLLPMYDSSKQERTSEFNESDGYTYTTFHGKGGCFPNVTYSLRKVYVVESDPVDPNHPIGKRIHYMDAQTFTLPRTVIYDRQGKYWKSWMIGQAHPDSHLPINKGTGVSIDDAFGMMDVQSLHCTTGQFKGIVDPNLVKKKQFSVQYMRSFGK
ncbi:MAG: outer membrane lipoprotein-sorting protein [Piscirickettsiaceae bacterium]|nr:MAG: outer membrane lipoprotein-sorting protein [Piscirickettsiaceae bacterium]